MKNRILFLAVSLVVIFSAILFSNLIVLDGIPLLPVGFSIPQDMLDEAYVTLGTPGGNDNSCPIWAANLADSTEIYLFTRLPFNAFVIQNGRIKLYAIPFIGYKALREHPVFTLMRMSEREEYADISHYLTALCRSFAGFDSGRFYGFHFDVPDEVKTKLRKVIAELSEIYDFKYVEGELSDFIVPREGFSWNFREEYGEMMWVYISSSDRTFSGNMEITVGKVTGSLGSIDITYLVEKVDGKWKTTRELSVGQS